ncbi:hypothetical protein NM208_g3118 [Fusarium decemcellulare]|uniref:Uncharacterized protein n=1 Tax=Fusarium decemcellulare TaxID=57161 RepID=A0ACC1SQH6_9HYPO|nr:hypothetical protein NM208_g3118 [Fusarium decemcellulare]
MNTSAAQHYEVYSLITWETPNNYHYTITIFSSTSPPSLLRIEEHTHGITPEFMMSSPWAPPHSSSQLPPGVVPATSRSVQYLEQGKLCGCLDHYFIPHQCGICNGGFRHLEQVVILLCREYPMGRWRLGLRRFGEKGYTCGETNTLREYEEQCDFVARVASSLTPDLEPLAFGGLARISVVIPDELGFSQMALKEANVPGLFKLPPEILARIQEFSREEPIWEWVRACALKLELAILPTTPSINPMSIADVDSWAWGQDEPNKKAASDDKPLIRITLDSRGITRIERLARHPLPLFENTLKRERFIVDSAARLKQVTIQFKDGLAWIQRPSEEFTLRLWDTPAPPAVIGNDLNSLSLGYFLGIRRKHRSTLDSCAMLWSNARNSTRFHTVDLKTCAGIMFSYRTDTGALHAIHDSRRPSPNTINKYTYLNRVYVPVPPGDEIVSITAFSDRAAYFMRVSRPLSFVIETKLAGDIHVGPQQAMLTSRAVRVEWPSTLIFGEPPLLQDFERPVLALYPNVTANLPLRFLGPKTRPQHDRSSGLWSWAPLDNVAQARVFYLDMECGLQGESFKGVHFWYENGAQRTIGQCYADGDWGRTWAKPSRLYYDRSYERQRLVFEKRPEGSNPWLWKENNMVGEIHYWIDSVFLSVSDDFEILPEGSWLTM